MPPLPPASRTVEASVDVGGRPVPDPYRWLEDLGSDEVGAWMDAQRAAFDAYIAEVGVRRRIRDRLDELVDHERRGAPWRRGRRWFQLRNPGLAPHDVLWVADAPDAEGRALLDPNAWSDDATTALTGLAVSRDAELVAYARSEQGSDWMTWRVREVATGRDLDDELRWSKFSGAAWHPDGSGLWYAAYDPPPPGEEHAAATTGQRLAFHRLGDDQADDAVAWRRPGEEDVLFSPEVTDDGRWLVISEHRGTDPATRLVVADLDGDGEPRPLVDEFDAAYALVGSVGDELLLLTDAHAPRGRIVALDATAAAPDPREVLAEGPDILEDARRVGDRLLTVHLVDASHDVRRHTLDGVDDGRVELPGLATVAGLTGTADDALAHLAVTTFTAPTAVLRHDLAQASTATAFRPRTAHDPAALVAEQAMVEADDGVRVPLFLLRRVDAEADGERPTLLTGYGGFRVPVTPSHRVSWTAWAEAGGVVAVASLRGGGEYGREWHEAGRLRNKQRVFDDALACADWLAASGWTRPGRLAVTGASNGGLLAAACLTQGPERFGAAVVEVGVLDMLRFHRSTIGWAWQADYGDPEDPDDAANLLAYSPYHNVRDGRAYPATLLTTGDHDDRVVPWHSLKMAAALQAAQGGDAPVLLRVERSGGHGAGKPLAKALDERADVLAFLTRALGIDEEAWT